MITTSDDINENWLAITDEMADRLEQGRITIDRFTDDQLHYLIYWNFGVSGAYIMPETKLAEAELIRRDNPYNELYAGLIDTKASESY
jgi:hypothetical protein